jgi:PhoPQ-activated pathogenicity-related protein
MNITNKLDDPRFDSLMEIIDPFSYRDKILMPKLVIDGTMDEFFLLDDSSYWWNQMPYAYELNRFLMVPNAEHTQITGIFLKDTIKNQCLKRIQFILSFKKSMLSLGRLNS